jgi:hypothetical protein
MKGQRRRRESWTRQKREVGRLSKKGSRLRKVPCCVNGVVGSEKENVAIK